jgi:hypothetical protein
MARIHRTELRKQNQIRTHDIHGPYRIHGLKPLPLRGGADEIHGYSTRFTHHTPHAHDLPRPQNLLVLKTKSSSTV